MIPALLLLLASPAAPKIAVLDVKARVGVSPELAQGITDALVSEVRRRATGATIISSEQIRTMLSFETQRGKLGCQDTTCLAELGGALGADELVIGTLGKFGGTYLLSVQRVAVRSARVLEEASLRLTGKDDDLLETVAQAVEKVFPNSRVPQAALEPTASAQATASGAPRSHVLSWVLFGGAAAAGAGAAVGLGFVLDYTSYNNSIRNNPASATNSISTAENKRGTANTWGTAAIVLAGVAAACTAGAILTW